MAEENAPEQTLIVGLGNPESEYADTRHNLGFDCVRALATRLTSNASTSGSISFRIGFSCTISSQDSSVSNDSVGPAGLG